MLNANHRAIAWSEDLVSVDIQVCWINIYVCILVVVEGPVDKEALSLAAKEALSLARRYSFRRAIAVLRDSNLILSGTCRFAGSEYRAWRDFVGKATSTDVPISPEDEASCSDTSREPMGDASRSIDASRSSSWS
jgi:hypothetical protein